jgi:hypothetical protein
LQDIRTSLTGLRKKVIEESNSKVTVDKFNEIQNKVLNFNDKLLTVKKEALVLKKTLSNTKGVDKNVQIVSMKNNDELELLKDEVNLMKANLKVRIEEVKKLQQDLVTDEVNKLVENVKYEAPVEEAPEDITSLLTQIKKQLIKNEQDIEFLQHDVMEKNIIIEELKEYIGQLKNT